MITGTTGGWDTGVAAGIRDFQKVNGLGKSNGRVKRVFGFAPYTFKSSMNVPAVTSGVTATAGDSGAKLAVLLEIRAETLQRSLAKRGLWG